MMIAKPVVILLLRGERLSGFFRQKLRFGKQVLHRIINGLAIF